MNCDCICVTNTWGMLVNLVVDICGKDNVTTLKQSLYFAYLTVLLILQYPDEAAK